MSKFRTLEISDTRFEANNLRYLTVKSPNLKGRGDICVYVPPAASSYQNIPVVILLHGVYGSMWSWTHSAGVHLKANEMISEGTIPPMVLAMPSDGLWGDGSAYLRHNGFDFEKWIAEDVIAALSEKIPCVGETSPLFISGLSMGGFGALRIGAKYGKLFRAVSAHSSITSLDQMKYFVEEDLSNYRQLLNADEDLFETIKNNQSILPPVRFDCGTGDHLLPYNQRLHQELTAAGIPHKYEEFEGAHEWSYWSAQVGRSLRFFAGHLYAGKLS